MVGGMARQGQAGRLSRALLRAAALAAAFACAPCSVSAQGSVQAQPAPPQPPAVRECQSPTATVSVLQLPNIGRAIKKRLRIKILAFGAAPSSKRDAPSGTYQTMIESFLERSFKGLDVEIINRGASTELARNAAERIKVEAALTEANLVLWQLGTADAMAQIPTEEFKQVVGDAIMWLKDHHIDVVLVGLRYMRSMANDPHYQAIREAVHVVARQQGVLRVGRYEAVETMERIRKQAGQPASENELSETGYACMADYLAKAIAAGLFAKDAPPP